MQISTGRLGAFECHEANRIAAVELEDGIPDHTGDPQLFRVDIGTHKRVSGGRLYH